MELEREAKFCPMTEDNCVYEKCMWFSRTHECCYISLGAWSLSEIRTSLNDTNRRIQQACDILRKKK